MQCGIAPFLYIGNGLAQIRKTFDAVTREGLAGLLVEIVGVGAPEEAERLCQLWQGRAAVLHGWEGGGDTLQNRLVHRLAFGFLEPRLQERQKARIVASADEVRIDVVQLGKVQPGRRAIDRLDREDLRRRFEREDFFVAMAPAKSEEIGIQRLR